MLNDLILIRRFEAVHRHASFSRAAAELGMTHSALTKSIQSLEALWGVKLFERTTRIVAPTEAGRRLAASASELLVQAANLRNVVIAGNTKLRVICGTAVLENYIAPAILAYSRLCPDVSVEVETMPPAIASEQLLNHRTDLLVFNKSTIDAMPDSREFESKIIIDEPYFMVFRKGHAVSSNTKDLDYVLSFDWIVAGFDSRYQTRLPKNLQAIFTKFGFPKYRIMSQSACIDSAANSDLITLVPQSAVKKLSQLNIFDFCPFPSNAQASVAVATNRGAVLSPIASSFIDAMKLKIKR